MLYIFEDNEAVIWLKIEVRRWDTCSEPTESRLIAYLTESIGIPKHPIGICSQQKTNSQTCWREAISPVMGGIIFSVCSTSWVFRSSLAVISVRSTNPKPRRRDRFRKKTWRRGTCDDKIETSDEFSVEGCQSVSNNTGYECIQQWGNNCSAEFEFNSDRTGMEKPVAEGLNENTASSSQVWHSDVNTWQAWGNPWRKRQKHRWYSPQLPDFQCWWPSWESLFECTTEIESSSRRRNAWHWLRRDDLGDLQVSDQEGGSTSWTR